MYFRFLFLNVDFIVVLMVLFIVLFGRVSFVSGRFRRFIDSDFVYIDFVELFFDLCLMCLCVM